MTDIFNEIDALFGNEQLPTDPSGCLNSAKHLLRGLDMSIIALADASGNPIAIVGLADDADVACTPQLLSEAAHQLKDQRLATFKFDCTAGVGHGFGVKLHTHDGEGILAGWVPAKDDTSAVIEGLYPVLVSWGGLAWFGIHRTQENAGLNRRIRHLQIEQDTLKQTHAQTVATVIEEREERIRQQREYVLQLENEVERRSAALREAMQKAKEANEAKSSFLANMSHEIRTPMTAILGYVDVLSDLGKEFSLGETQVEAIETIRRNGNYLLELINDILDLAKVESGKLECERIPTSPMNILHDVQDLMRVRADARKLALSIDYDGPIPSVIHTDPTRLRQILVNLVGNAIKFTQAGGVRIRVQLNTMADGAAGLAFHVIDTGIGLTSDQRDKLFRPFAQADASTTRRHGGTGLGLALSRRLASALGGDVSVTSEPGQGSDFCVTIAAGSLNGVPMIDCRSDVEVPQTPQSSAAPAKTKLDCRILVADDGEDNRRLLKHILTRAGAEVTVVDNGQKAVDTALAATKQLAPFDVILMDMQMPILDGYQATRTLRQEAYTRSVIALTAHAMASDREKCLRAGCDDYATKPVDRHALLAMIADHVDRQRAGSGQHATAS